MAVESAAVGVFDSGVGGLSVLREIRARAAIRVALADNAHVPYQRGVHPRTRERIGDFLLEQGAKALVLANATAAAVANCANSAGAAGHGAGGEAGRGGHPQRWGRRPGHHRNSEERAFRRLARPLRQRRTGSPSPSGLVERIEAGDLYGPQTRHCWMAPILEQGCDTLILGCTHYPFVKPLLAELIPAGDGSDRYGSGCRPATGARIVGAGATGLWPGRDAAFLDQRAAGGDGKDPADPLGKPGKRRKISRLVVPGRRDSDF